MISLSEKFGYRLSKKFTLLREQRYIGDKVQEISLPPVYDTKNPMFTSPSHYTVYAQQVCRFFLSSVLNLILYL